MDELELTRELYLNMLSWMMPKYALTTIHNRAAFLKRIFNSYKVLNNDTLRKIMKLIKAQDKRACLVMINSYCYDNEIPFHIIIPSTKRQAIKLPEILSPAEIKLMINSAPAPYDLAIRCIFNMGAGLRISEIIKISWDHIRWIDWLSKKENYGIAVIKSGKGSKDRIVNIPRKLMSDLYEYAKSENVLNEFGIPVGGMMFPFGSLDKNNNLIRSMQPAGNTYDERWKTQYITSRYNWFRYHILQLHCEKALNKHIKIHSLRHSRATYLYEYENVPIEKISILLGHSSLNTTMLYTRVNPRSVFELIKDTKEI